MHRISTLDSIFARVRFAPSHFSPCVHWAGILLLVLLTAGCTDWNEFGGSPTNAHASHAPGPDPTGLTTRTDLLAPGSSTSHGYEVSVLVDSAGDFYVSSLSSEIHVYDPTGTHQAVYSLGGAGSRAAPYVDNDFLRKRSMIFTGANSGGFYAIEVDKSTPPYTMTLRAEDTTVGASESSPKRAQDGTLYIADSLGTVRAFEYLPSTSDLKPLGSHSLGEGVTGGIALYDVDPTSPHEEVLVATSQGNLYVLDHSLSSELWKESTGTLYDDEYYAGVTVAKRGSNDPVALLPIGAETTPIGSPKSGLLRAINLSTQSVEWELRPSATTPGEHKLLGSVSLLHGFETIGGGSSTIDPGSGVDTGIDPGGLSTVGDLRDELIGFRNDLGDDLDPGNDDPGQGTPPEPELTYLAAFTSTDGYLYGVDIGTGLEVWSYAMTAPGFDAPVTDRDNIVYAGDGDSVLHAVSGHTGYPFWTNSSIATSVGTDIVKLGLTLGQLIAASGTEAYSLE